MQSQFDTEDRLRQLEWRLDKYHEHLEDALDYDRQFQLKATWGIVTSACGLSAVLGLVWLANWFKLEGWVFSVVVGIGWMFAFVAGASWAERGREGDLKKLSRLPVWKDGQP